MNCVCGHPRSVHSEILGCEWIGEDPSGENFDCGCLGFQPKPTQPQYDGPEEPDINF